MSNSYRRMFGVKKLCAGRATKAAGKSNIRDGVTIIARRDLFPLLITGWIGLSRNRGAEHTWTRHTIGLTQGLERQKTTPELLKDMVLTGAVESFTPILRKVG